MTHLSELRQDFDTLVTISERNQRDANIASNDAFVAAMARAVIKKKEKATPGTYRQPGA